MITLIFLALHAFADCTGTKIQTKALLETWKNAAMPAKEVVALNQRTRIALTKDATFIAKPETTFANAPFGAVTRFKTDKHDLYVIAAATKVWIDVVDSEGHEVASIDHESLKGCTSLHKLVKFKLKPETTYTLQLSSSETSSAELVVAPE